MKTILLFLIINSYSYAQDTASYKIIGWHQESGVTLMKIEFSFNVWCVFQLEGNHLGESDVIISNGCVLTQRWGLFYFSDVPESRYCKPGDEEKLKIALGLDKICKPNSVK